MNNSGSGDASGTIYNGSTSRTISHNTIGALALAGGTMTGQIVLKEGTNSSDYSKGLRFPNDPYGGSGDASGLRLYADTSTGAEAQVLELYCQNDAPGTSVDKINFAAPNNDLVTVNGNKIWNSGNLSSPVGGTGTTNYLPKFTSGTTIGNSQVFDNGTNVGIGTASPKSYATLTNAGQFISLVNIGIDTGQAYKLNSYYSSAATADRTISTGFAASIGLDNAVGAITFGISSSSVSADNNIVSTERIRITSGGNVGIGTNNPGEQLTLSRSTYPTVKLIETTDNASAYFQYHSDANEFRLLTISSHPLIFSTTDTERMRITSGGNVGIGVTDPFTRLHINGTLTFTESGFSTVRRHSISNSHSDGSSVNNYLAFNISDGSGTTAERMRVNGSGNVLIGTTTDNGARLQVNGGITVAGTSALADNELRIRGITDQNHAIVNNATINGPLSYGYFGSGLGWTEGSTAQIALMNVRGNVLIGTTTNGASKLRIVGLPTSSAGLSSGDIWNDGGTLKIA
jgi:hypothetical protein